MKPEQKMSVIIEAEQKKIGHNWSQSKGMFVIIEARAKENQTLLKPVQKKFGHYWSQIKRELVIIKARAKQGWSLLKP